MAMEVLDLAIAHKKALVCGSTGFSAEEMKRFEDAGKQIPMLYAANTSKLVNIMNKLLELVTTTLKDEIDIEILEMHDQWKKDAPSGTSKEMGENHGACSRQRIKQHCRLRTRGRIST